MAACGEYWLLAQRQVPWGCCQAGMVERDADPTPLQPPSNPCRIPGKTLQDTAGSAGWKRFKNCPMEPLSYPTNSPLNPSRSREDRASMCECEGLQPGSPVIEDFKGKPSLKQPGQGYFLAKISTNQPTFAECLWLGSTI